MANAIQENVIFVDTTAATYAHGKHIVGIKYIGNASGTATIKSQDSSGTTLWEESGSSNTFNQVDIKSKDGIYVTLTNSAKVYIYLK